MTVPLYNDHTSAHPPRSLTAAPRFLFQRAITHCNKEEDQEKEVRKCLDDLLRDNYPLWAIKKALHQALDKKEKKDKSNDVRPRMFLPFMGPRSFALKRQFARIGINVIQTTRPPLLRCIENTKDRLDKTRIPGAIYRVPCNDCPASY